jgi:hypothetical protein
MKKSLMKYLALGLPVVALLLSGCGGGSSDQGSVASISYATLNPPETLSTGYVGLTGIRGVDNSTDVYITGSLTSNGLVTDQLYKGPILGGGIYYTMNYPSTPGATVESTTSYSVDNLRNGQVSVTGTYKTTQSGNLQGYLYQGPLINNPTTGWTALNFPGAQNTNPHSVMGDLVVGGYYTPGDTLIKAFIYQISTGTIRPFKVFDDDISTTAYGVWWNGGNSYTIVGGFARLGTAGKGYILDYDISTGVKSNITVYSYNNAPTIVTHFEGITLDDSGGFNLAGTGTDSSGANAAFLHVKRLSTGGYTPDPKWITVKYPNSTTTTSDTVYKNYLLGVYNPGPAALNGYVATIPASMYK